MPGSLGPWWGSQGPCAQKVPQAGGGAWRAEGNTLGWHHPTLAPPSYLQLQPGGGLCAHPVGIGAPQALSTEGPVASWPLTDEVQQILVGKEERGGRP